MLIAVVLGCSRETSLFIRLLAGKPGRRKYSTWVVCVKQNVAQNIYEIMQKKGIGSILPLGRLLMREITDQSS